MDLNYFSGPQPHFHFLNRMDQVEQDDDVKALGEVIVL